ncbi:hypothetical protein RQP46_005911 [Phenoliferia psychrophenolica]
MDEEDAQDDSGDLGGPVASGSSSALSRAGGDTTGASDEASGLHWDAASKAGYRGRYNKWGLLPSWLKRPPEKPLSTINCRADTLFSGQGMWSGIRNSKRCIVVADGFYEWLNKGKDKIPHFTKLPGGKLMVLAGLYDAVTYQNTTEVIKTFTIITTDVNKQLFFLHDRMPAILTSEDEISLWLSSSPWSPAIQALIRPYDGVVECYKVPAEPVSDRKGNIMSMFAAQAASSPAKPTKNLKPDPSPSKPLQSSSTSAGKKRERSSSVEIVEPPPKKAATPAASGGSKVAKKKKRSYTKKDEVKTDTKGNGLVTSFFRKEEAP